MGNCCSSRIDDPSAAAAAAAAAASSSPSKKKPAASGRYGQPPEPEAEEKVKEVLSVSETPKSNPRPPIKHFDGCPEQKNLNNQEQTAAAVAAKGFSGGFPVPAADDFDGGSEGASEAYSEGLSSSTAATLTEKESLFLPTDVGKAWSAPPPPPAGQAASKYHQRKRSISGEFGCRSDRSVAVGRASSRRSSPSPVRRAGDAAVGRTNSGRVLGCARRDPGERSGRRSISPAVKRVAEARHDNVSVAAAVSAGGVQYKGAPVSRANGRAWGDEASSASASASASAADDIVGGGGGGGGHDEGEGKESLDNPLVSLECFIFL